MNSFRVIPTVDQQRQKIRFRWHTSYPGLRKNTFETLGLTKDASTIQRKQLYTRDSTDQERCFRNLRETKNWN